MDTSKKQLLTVSNIGKTFGRKTVLKEIDFTIQDGEVIGIIGPMDLEKQRFLIF